MRRLLLLLALLIAAPVLAQSNGARARAAFMEGQAEYNLGHFDKALAHYEDAYKIKAVPALLFNIAQCHRQLGAMREAATTYKAYLRTAADKDPNRVKAEALLSEVEVAVAKQAQAQGAKPLGSMPDTDGVKPPAAVEREGPPQIDATAVEAAAEEQKSDEKKETLVASAANSAINKSEPQAATTRTVPEAALETPAAAPSSSRGRTFTWVAAGGATAALAAGALFGLKSKSAASDLTSKHHQTSEVDKLQSDVSSNAGKANALFAVGGVLAAATGVLFALKF